MFYVTKTSEHSSEKKVNASADIPTGTVVLQFTGLPINFSDSKQLGEKESYALQVGNDRYLFLDEPAYFFNHSCEPNCGLTPQLQLITLRDVKEDEELTYDYSTTMFERSWKMRCHCNKPTCRKVIEDFDLIPRALQQHYLHLNVVQDYIRQQVKAA